MGRGRLQADYCESSSPLFAMRVVLVGAYLALGAAIVGLFFASPPEPAPDRAGYAVCREIHPARYCAITFLGAK
jgi:hypothetical protein